MENVHPIHHGVNSPTHPFLHVGLALLGLQRLAHTEGYAALVQRLVGRQGQLELVPDPQQQQPSLCTAHRGLADQLVCK